MQLGEAVLPSSAINLPKPFYSLSSESNNNNNSSSPGSGPLEFQEVSRTESHPGNGPKKYLSSGVNDMLNEGESDTFTGTKTAPDGRKSSAVIGEDDLSNGRRYNIDELGSDRYFLSSSQPASDVANPCSLFPYAAQTGTVYPGSNGSRYSTSLHYGSVLPPTGFSSAVCASRSQFGAGYQFGQGPGCLYPSYPGTSSGIASVPIPAAGAGARAQVYLCNRPLWLKFHRHQTEMIITKQGRYANYIVFSCCGTRPTMRFCIWMRALQDVNLYKFVK